MSAKLEIPSLIYKKEIQQICEPLKKLHINYFSHAKFDRENQFSVICNNPEFMELYHHKEYYNIDIHTADLNQYNNFVLWDLVPRSGKTLQMGKDAADLNILHTFTIIEKNSRSTDFFHFSTSLDNEMVNQLYLSQLPILKLFINYFKNKVSESKDLAVAHKHKIQVANPEGYIVDPEKTITFPTSENFISLLQSDNNIKAISKREKDVINLLLKGQTAKMISETLFIAERTVEHHIENIKRKLCVRTKAELIEKIILLFPLIM